MIKFNQVKFRVQLLGWSQKARSLAKHINFFLAVDSGPYGGSSKSMGTVEMLPDLSNLVQTSSVFAPLRLKYNYTLDAIMNDISEWKSIVLNGSRALDADRDLRIKLAVTC